MTKTGYGKRDQHYDDHPMLELTGIIIDGVEFCYNDLFRATHDLFGHALTNRAFNLAGEFCAGYVQMQMYSNQAKAVIFSEIIGQISAYYFDQAGHKVTAQQREYTDQKVMLFNDDLLYEFEHLFK